MRNFTVTLLAASALTLPVRASAQNMAVSGNYSVSGTSMAGTIASPAVQSPSGWPNVSLPCKTLLGTTVNTGACLNVKGGTSASVGTYFDRDMSSSSSGGVGLLTGSANSGAAATTNQLLYLQVDQGAVGGGDVQRIRLDNSSTTTNIWLGMWFGGYGGVNSGAMEILSANSNHAAAWKTGISTAATYNTVIADGSSGGVSGVEIGGSHATGLLSDAATTYSLAMMQFPSDPLGGISGIAWWADVAKSGAGNAALGATDLNKVSCGLCVSTQATSSATTTVTSAPVTDVRFRTGGGVTADGAVGLGVDGGGGAAAWEQTFTGSGATASLSEAGGTTSAIPRVLARSAPFVVRADTTCANSTGASEVETIGVYTAAGALVSQSSLTLTGSATITQTLAARLTTGAPLGTASFSGGSASCTADAFFGDFS